MASSLHAVNPLIGYAVTEKLTKANHALWKAQVLAMVRGARLEGHLNGASKPPPATLKEKQGDKVVDVPDEEHSQWMATDQQVLAFLLSSVTKEILSQVAASATAAGTWGIIQGMLSSMTRARAVSTRIALATTKKGDMSIAEYVGKTRSPSLDLEYNPIVSALVSRSDAISVGEVYSQLLSFEQRMELLHGDTQHLANIANQGRGSQRGRGSGRGGNRGRGRGNQPRQNTGGANNYQGGANNNNSKPRCQLCLKEGHEVIDCWYRFEEDFVPNKKYAGSATTSYGVNMNWYTDSGASDHVTGDLEKLTVRDRYKGQDQVHTASWAGMSISHIGHSIVKTPSRDLHLKNILYVPNANKNLVFVHRLATDNSAFLEFHPNFFLIKNQVTKKTLLRGRCQQGLYSLPSAPPNKQAFSAIKQTFEKWHNRLGHPSSPIVEKVISNFKLPILVELNKNSVCDACQKAKNHQLPYSSLRVCLAFL